jgi:predicted Zn-dependent peptidase
MPVVKTAPAYLPPRPEVFTAANGMQIWLVERHTLPYVAMAAVIPTGASRDPKGAGGLAMMAADMLDEGAGSRDAIELSRAIEGLGASLETTATSDLSRVSLSVLKKNLTPGFHIFADVIARPRLTPLDWKREHDIVVGELTQRQSDPDEVAKVVDRAVVFGASHPYGHPVEGTLASSKSWTLAEVTRFYKDAWRPDRTTLVAVGDITRGELTALVDSKEGLGTWHAPKQPPPASVEPLSPPAPTGPWPKIVMVDRADAPQSVISVVRPGIAAADPAAPIATRANVTLGVIFTSRLNQDLREEHGYTYGASSRVGTMRGPGLFVATAAVVTEKTTDALKAMLGDLDAYARNGLSDAEVEKTRTQSRAEVVETFEMADRAATLLAVDAALGLGPDHERDAAARKDVATKAELDAQAKQHFDPSSAVIVVVGPRAKLDGPIRALGYTDIQYRDAEGAILSDKAPAKKPKK